MAEGKELQLTITSPYGEIVQKTVHSVLFTTPEGEIVLRAKHQAGMYAVKEGSFFVKTDDETQEYQSLGGMVTIHKDAVSFLSPLAAHVDQFEKEKEKHLQLLAQRYSEDLKSEADLQRVQMALRNSLIQKK